MHGARERPPNPESQSYPQAPDVIRRARPCDAWLLLASATCSPGQVAGARTAGLRGLRCRRGRGCKATGEQAEVVDAAGAVGL
ncbi:MAG: hypothetical protein RIR76_1651 [Verrucomicrobiota bacterium]